MDFYTRDSDVAALEIRLPTEPERERAAGLVQLAWYLRQRDSSRALALCEEAEALVATLGLSEPEAQRLFARLSLVQAEVALLQSQFARARAKVQAAGTGFQSAGDPVGLGDATLARAGIAHSTGDAAAAQTLCGEASTLFDEGGDPLRQKIAGAWARYYSALHDPDAIDEWLDATASAPDLDAHPAVDAIAAATEAIIWTARGEIGRGVLCNARASELALSGGMIRLSLVSALNVGGWMQSLGDFEGALDWIERALDRAKRTGWPDVVAMSLLRLGELQRRLNQLERSRDLLTEALGWLANAPRNSNKGVALDALGATLLAMGKHEDALAAYEEAEAIYREANHVEGLVSALVGEARVLSQTGRPGAALRKVEAAREALGERCLRWQDVELAQALAEIHCLHALPPPPGMTAPNATVHYLEQAYALGRLKEGWNPPPALLMDLSRAWEQAGGAAVALRYAREAYASQERESIRRATVGVTAAQLRYEAERARLDTEYQRRLAEAELRRAVDLETRVTERTAELEKLNRELARESAERATAIAALEREVKARREIQEQLVQAQKMEALGQLTGGMAHDFNNLLGIGIGNLDLLQARPMNDPEVEELSREALEALLRGAELIQRLLAFARRQPLQPRRVALNDLVVGTTKLLKRTLGEQIEIFFEPGADIWPVVVDPAQLESSLTNLATNARDAMPNGGRLLIQTSNRHLDEDYTSQHAELQPGAYAVIKVTDTGTGMSPEIVKHIFEPFFTTKEHGKGTGLGLSMVFGFIKQSGGHINVYSEVGVGTTFSLYLPSAEVAAKTTAAAHPPMLPTANNETVLIVEDDAGLRRIAVRQLKELGYRVLEAENARTALSLLERQEIDLLFTDIIMPGGTSGYDLALTTRARWPRVKIVLTSGFPDDKIYDLQKLADVPLLTKPCRRDELARTIREALGKVGEAAL